MSGPEMMIAGSVGSSLMGKSAQRDANRQIRQMLEQIKPFLEAPMSVSTPSGSITGGYNPDTGFSYDYDFNSPFRGALEGVFETTDDLRPLGFEIYDRASRFDDDRGRFLGLYDDLGGLRQTVKPGFSDLRERRLEAVGLARDKAMGNLRDSLTRRRTAGSSFANDSIARAEAEFGKLRSDTEAQTFLEELDANMKLIGQQQSVGTSAMQALQSRIQSELNAFGGLTNLAQIDASAASAGLSADLQMMSNALGGIAQLQNFTTNMLGLINSNAQAQAEIAASSAAGYGQLAGNLLGYGIMGQQSAGMSPFTFYNNAMSNWNPFTTTGNAVTP